MKKFLVTFIFPTLITLIFFTFYKAYIWWSFKQLFVIYNYKTLIKVLLTILLSNPPINENGKYEPEYVQKIPYIFENIDDKISISFIEKFPAPKKADKITDSEELIIYLRNWVSTLLPENNGLSNSNEPESPFEILGENVFKKKYVKICSVDAKLFTTYLSIYGLKSRIIQLHQHIAVEVYNSELDKWELHDPHYNFSYKYNGEYLSARELLDLINRKFNVVMPYEESVFNTIVIVPKNNFLTNKKIELFGYDVNYFNYDNLAYWLPIHLTDKSDSLWHILNNKRKNIN